MRYRRVFVPGGTYFFTVNLQNRSTTLLTDKIDCLRFALKKTMFYYPYSIEGLVVLPDHLHMLMHMPETDKDYSVRWNMIKGLFSKQISAAEKINSARKNKRERGIWQRRFWEHLIRNERDYEKHLNYIHYNPVKHGYVDTPWEWKYSSIHRLRKEGVVPKNWACDIEPLSNGFGE